MGYRGRGWDSGNSGGWNAVLPGGGAFISTGDGAEMPNIPIQQHLDRQSLEASSWMLAELQAKPFPITFISFCYLNYQSEKVLQLEFEHPSSPSDML